MPIARNRRSIRAKRYDYTHPGIYFITLCAHERRLLFGEIRQGCVGLSRLGCIVAQEWQRTPERRLGIELDEFVIMPNHFHAVVMFTKPALVGAHNSGARSAPLRPAASLGSLIAGFKAAVTSRARATGITTTEPIWQRNYYEHIVRDDRALAKIREYICGNPFEWESDRENPKHTGESPFARWFRNNYL